MERLLSAQAARRVACAAVLPMSHLCRDCSQAYQPAFARKGLLRRACSFVQTWNYHHRPDLPERGAALARRDSIHPDLSFRRE